MMGTMCDINAPGVIGLVRPVEDRLILSKDTEFLEAVSSTISWEG